MALGLDKRRAFRSVAGPIVAAVLIAYFALSAFQGDRGVLRIIQLRQEILRAEATLRIAQTRRESLDRRAGALRTAGLDRDYLDERTRLMTGLMGASDVVLTGAAPDVAARRSRSIVGAVPALPR